jgi:hypothetical protein
MAKAGTGDSAPSLRGRRPDVAHLEVLPRHEREAEVVRRYQCAMYELVPLMDQKHAVVSIGEDSDIVK